MHLAVPRIMAMYVVVYGATRDQLDQISRQIQSDIACLCGWLGGDKTGDGVPS